MSTASTATTSGVDSVSGFESKFVCAQASGKSESDTNPNRHLTDELQKLAKAYKSTNDKWRAYAYEKAISAIKRYARPISSGEEAAKIPGLGEKMASKVDEIISMGSIRKVEGVCNSEKVQAISLFTGVWGIGPTTAEVLYNQGHRSLEDLKTKATLTRQQTIGLRLYDDLNERMSHDEAGELDAFVRQHAMELSRDLEVIGCGSFRRGKKTCGDLDVLITSTNPDALKGLLDRLVSNLEAVGFLTDHLAFHTDGNQRKYMGVCRLPGEGRLHRRLDIIVVPYQERGCSLVYFTGSAHFNRSLRLLAIKKGMSLSEHALCKNVSREHNQKLTTGEIIPTPTEASIFEALGVPYREPCERDH